MKDSLFQLVSDTLLYMKDPLHPKESLMATEEECLLLNLDKAEKPAAENGKEKDLIAKIESSQVVNTPSKPKSPLHSSTLITPKQEPLKKTPPLQPAKPLSPIEPAPLMKAMLSKIAPGMRLTDHVPDDALGKRVSLSWKEKITDVDVVLLACKQDAENLDFLKTLAKAIDTHLAKAKIIPVERLERENCWDIFLQTNTFRLIIASEGFEQLQNLIRFYRENPAQNAYFLDKIPLLPLSATAIYKQLEKKAELWKTLCQILKR